MARGRGPREGKGPDGAGPVIRSTVPGASEKTNGWPMPTTQGAPSASVMSAWSPFTRTEATSLAACLLPAGGAGGTVHRPEA